MSTLPELERLALEYNESGHSIYGPSSSAMWLYCSGSLIANLQAEDHTTYEAAEGTVAHGIAETWLTTGKRPDHLVGTSIQLNENGQEFNIPVTRVMLNYLERYVNWCKFLPGKHYVETKVYFSEYMPIKDQGGTADHAACLPGELIITDLKYGSGIFVEVAGNTQARLYALGFYLKYNHLYNFKKIRLRIAQPRLDNFDEEVITEEELLAFADYAKERAYRAWDLNAPRRPSPKGCQWCRVRTRCTAMLRMAVMVVEGDVEQIGKEYSSDDLSIIPDLLARSKFTMKPARHDQLSDEQLAALLPYRKVIETWFARVHFECEARALQGRKIPRHKLVESRTNRSFRDDNKASEHLEFIGLSSESFIKKTMYSPAQTEDLIQEVFGVSKSVAASLIESEVVKPSGKPTLVAESDKRPPYNSHIEDLLIDDDDYFDDDDEL